MALSVNQLKCIELECDPSVTYTVAQLAEKLNVTERAIYKWRNNEAFLNERMRRIRQLRAGILFKAYRKLEKLIDADSVTLIKFVLENWDDDISQVASHSGSSILGDIEELEIRLRANRSGKKEGDS